ncbi:tetratricopeptide repeat protein [Bradyrhizobium sp. 1200_D9_N1_1]|uniref:tetratricopeptide repeat protein n=1 Tax=Bradyrhizobium sp. 1200_D9_N1_1 TaxID=3239013 RepID=UPI003F8A409E
MTNSEVSTDLPDKPTSDNEQPDKATSDKEQLGKPPSDRDLRNLKSRLRARLQLIGGALASIAAIGAIAGGLVGYWTVWKTLRTDVFPDKQQTQREATARPDVAPRLSLVVLPFANLNNDPEQDYFADSITTDLTTDLAQMPGAFVIGRGTAFTFKNKQIDFKTLGKELGIRWAVQGAVRRNGDQIRVNVSLTDAASGRDIWSDRFDGDRTNLAALQDQITGRLARSLNIELMQAESRRSEKDQSRNPDAMDFTMRGWAKFYEPRSKTEIAQAKDLFDRALHLDPDNVDAMIAKAWCLAIAAGFRWSTSMAEDKEIATDLIDRALAKSSSNALAYVVKGDTLRVFGRPEEALPEYDAALEINPNFPIAYAQKGLALILSGRAREAFSPLQLALRLSPKDPIAVSWYYNLCHAHLHLQEYEEATKDCRRVININNAFWYAYVDLVSAYGASGQLEPARQSLTELNKIRPDFTIQWFREFGYGYSSNPQFRREFDEILDGLRKGGVREQ